MTELITWLGRRDHFFLVPSLGVGCVRINTFIANALMLDWRRNWLSPTVGPGLIFALGSGLPGRSACMSKRRVKSPEWHEQCQRHP